jgi:thiol-disulfide isomerase/thioredoxin
VLVGLALAVFAGGCSGAGGADGTLELGDADGAASMALERLDGEGTIRLADYAGQPLVVNFFAETCAPCVDEMPAFEQVKQAAAGEVAFLGVSTQESVEAGRSLVERTGVTWDLVRDPQGAFIRTVEGVGLPTTLLLGPDGDIVARRTGGLDEGELSDLLADELGIIVESSP